MKRVYYAVEEINSKGEWLDGTGSYDKKDAERFAQEVEQYHPGQPGRLKESEEIYVFLVRNFRYCTPLSEDTLKLPMPMFVVGYEDMQYLIETKGLVDLNIEILTVDKPVAAEQERLAYFVCKEGDQEVLYGVAYPDMDTARAAADEDSAQEQEFWKQAPDSDLKEAALSRSYAVMDAPIYRRETGA